jgi:hypothetical protein
MASQSLKNALVTLDYIRKHPLMFMSADVPAVQNFMTGFQMAWSLAYPETNFSDKFQQLATDRGWNSTTKPVWLLMQEQGLSADAIIQELLDLHYETWKQVVQSSEPEILHVSNGA